jgi:hypothetical protein
MEPVPYDYQAPGGIGAGNFHSYPLSLYENPVDWMELVIFIYTSLPLKILHQFKRHVDKLRYVFEEFEVIPLKTQ